jgi:hypothetical protein
MQQAKENVHSFAFAEFFDRLWLILSSVSDFAGLTSVISFLRGLWRDLDLSWMDKVDEDARLRREEDARIYA